MIIAPSPVGTHPGRRERRAERRRLQHVDALSARVAELLSMRSLLAGAVEVVETGWVRGAWFAVDSAAGTRVVAAYDVDVARDRPVVGACLVGSVVATAGGPATARSQLVQRTLDLTWHVLREDPDRPVHWCPAPAVRTLRTLELTRWNDAPGRTRGEVVGLLVAAERAADRQRDACRADRLALG